MTEQTALRWVSVYERNPIVDDDRGAVLVANAWLGVVLGSGRFTTNTGNNAGEPVWQVYCPYNLKSSDGVVTLDPNWVTHWLDGVLPPVPTLQL